MDALPAGRPWRRRLERGLAIVGALSIIIAVFLAWYWLRDPFSDWLQPLSEDPIQPGGPITLAVDGTPRVVKFSIHGTGPPVLGPEFWFYVLTDGSIVCDVGRASEGTTTRHSDRITPRQAGLLQRFVVLTRFMWLPTNMTRPMIVCPPFHTLDIYFWDDLRGHLVRHYEGDTTRPEIAMMEAAIWDAFDLDRWLKPESQPETR